MSKYRCKCGNIVLEGEIEIINGKKKFISIGNPNGTLIRQGSKNPESWDAVCSECQKKQDKEKKNEDKIQPREKRI